MANGGELPARTRLFGSMSSDWYIRRRLETAPWKACLGICRRIDPDKEGFTTELTCSPVMYLDAASCERNQTRWSRFNNAVDDKIGVGKFGGRQGLYTYAELFTQNKSGGSQTGVEEM